MVGDSRGTDNGINLAILIEVAAQIVAEQPDLVLFPGDLFAGSTDANTLTSQLTNWCGHDHFHDHARIDDQDGNADGLDLGPFLGLVIGG